MTKKTVTPPNPSPPTGSITPEQLDKPLDISDIKTEKANELRAIQQSFKRKVLNVKKGILKTTVETVDQHISEIDSLVKSNKYLEHASLKLSMKGRQILTQLADLELSLSSKTLDRDERAAFQSMKAELEKSLPAILDRELYSWFSGEMFKFKSELVQLREKAAENEQISRKGELDQTIRARVAVMKGYEDVNMLRGDIMKSVDICTSVPKGVREILFHPVWLSRKLEREFTVIVEKSHDTHSKNDGCWIAGTTKDVDACVARLESMDIAGRRTLILDGKSIGTIMGIAGANAYELEQEFGVVIYSPPGSVELTLFGSETSVGKTLKKISTLIGFDPTSAQPVTQSSESFAPNIVTERVACNTCVAKAIRSFVGSDLEEKCGVTISINPVVENPRESWIVVRGLNEGVSNATQELGRIIKTKFALETVEGPSKEAVDTLLSGSSSTARKGMSEIRLVMRFNELKKLGVFAQVPNHPETIDVCVSDPKKMDQVVGELLEILDRVLYCTEYVELDPHHYRCWTESVCSQVGNKAKSEAGGDVEIMCRRNGGGEEGKFHLEIWGSRPGIEKSKKFVAEVHSAKMIAVPEEAVKPMLENKCQVIQSIQEDAVVSIHFNKNESVVYMYGLNGSKKIGEKMFSDFVQSVRDSLLQSTIKSIPIASDEIGRLIGPKGKTMLSIKERSDLEDIRVSDEGKVFLTGTNANIDHAISLIEEELSSRKDATVVQIGLGEDPETQAALEAGKAGATASGSTGRRLVGADKTNEWLKNSSDKPSGEFTAPPVVASEDLFPSLGAIPARRNNMSWRGRGKGSSDLIRRGSAFRAPVSSTFDPFEVPLERLGEPIKLVDEDQTLLNSQRVLVNYLLSPGDDMYMRVPLGASEGTLSLMNDGTGSKPLALWKRLSAEIGSEYYPVELMTDSRSVMLGITSKKKAEGAKKKVSLAALEQSEQTGGGDGEGGESPKSNAENVEEEEDDDSIGADDYLVGMDFEDEGARDDDYADEDGGGGDYGGEF